MTQIQCQFVSFNFKYNVSRKLGWGRTYISMSNTNSAAQNYLTQSEEA